jgi:outer membrane receptor for ferrienterochelin and colicin
MVDNIYIAKGANSVLQGFESISGQINVETKEVDDTEKLYLNTYINNFGEKHLNANVAIRNGRWSNLSSIHTIFPAGRVDRDKDQFLDLPLLSRIRLSNKTKYGNELETRFYSSFGVRYLDEQRIGGQKSFNRQSDLGSASVYGQTVEIQQPEFWTKTGYRFNNKHNFKLFASSFYQNQNSYFGTVKYDANQTNIYGNLQYELNYGQQNLKTGFSYRHLHLNEDIQFTSNRQNNSYDGVYVRDEHILGFFAENTLNLFENKLAWISGLRVDDHNQFGTQITPRTLLKYNITPTTVIRANIGTGWRTVNLFSENINLLVSSRDIVFKEEIKPELALNSGINVMHKFGKEDFSGYFTIDYYRTDFRNQIFPDYDNDPTKAIIENFEGESISSTFQGEVYFNLYERFELKASYTFLDVYRMIEGKKELLPFNARHKMLGSFSYKPPSNKYHLDINTHWYGKQRLPNTMSNPLEFQRPNYSASYAVLNIQYTHNFEKFEVYLGCENIFDFRQIRPIISWEDPFGPYFDTSSVWGPTRGREFYLGARYKIP